MNKLTPSNQHQTPKIAYFYDPYIDTIGGGERYTFTLAEYLLKNGWNIVILNGNKDAITKLKQRFDLDLTRAELTPLPGSIIKRWQMTKNADLFFWVSDGSIPLMFSKNNILHFQVPFHDVNGKSLANNIKLKKIKHIVCNSEFTKRFIDKEYGVNSVVIYPPVDVSSFKEGKKENIILTVGRFSKLLQAKRQDILIEAFKKMVDKGLKGWRFQLAGSTDIGGTEYLNELRQSAENYPIEFFENCSYDVLKNLYSKSKIFWYAGGYGIDEEKEPEKVEHFGITLVEGMAAGCVPIVIEKGGLKEIVTDNRSGIFWKTEDDLIRITNSLIKDEKTIKIFSDEAIKESKKYGIERFNEDFEKII